MATRSHRTMKRSSAWIALLVVGAQGGIGRAPWVLSPAPVVTVGSDAGELPYEFLRIGGALRLADRSIVVGNSGSGELRYFDSTGRHVKSVGRHGAGPGEFGQFSSIRPLVIGKDRLIAQDAESQRVNVFDLSGRYLRLFRFEPKPAAALVTLMAADGTGIVGRSLRDAGLRGEPGEILEPRFQYAMFDSAGAQRNALFELPGRSRFVHAWQGSIHYPFIPFISDPAIALGAGKVFVVRGDSAVVEVWSTAGRRLTTFRWPAQRVRVRDIWSRYKEAELAAMSQERDRARYGHYFGMDLPLPEHVPIANQVQVDRAGNLWIERFRLRWEAERRWDVLGPQGRFLGTVTVPGRLEVYQVGADFMLGRARDSLDVEQIQVWRLLKRP